MQTEGVSEREARGTLADIYLMKRDGYQVETSDLPLSSLSVFVVWTRRGAVEYADEISRPGCRSAALGGPRGQMVGRVDWCGA